MRILLKSREVRETVQIQNAVVVVAHPDDEILWFSSILQQCKCVLVCFGPSATSRASWDGGRAALMEKYPLSKAKFLKIRESNAFGAANWNNPKEADSGLQVGRHGRSKYEKNAEKLLQILEQELTGERLVFTHNPWGEYGNEEHVQVFRILWSLRERLGFELYVTNYVSDKSVKLMSKSVQSLDGDPLMLETDKALAQQLKSLYLENNCWTWMEDHEWPKYEFFHRVTPPTERAESPVASFPLNYLTYSLGRSALRRFASKAVPAAIKSRIKRTYSA